MCNPSAAIGLATTAINYAGASQMMRAEKAQRAQEEAYLQREMAFQDQLQGQAQNIYDQQQSGMNPEQFGADMAAQQEELANAYAGVSSANPYTVPGLTAGQEDSPVARALAAANDRVAASTADEGMRRAAFGAFGPALFDLNEGMARTTSDVNQLGGQSRAGQNAMPGAMSWIERQYDGPKGRARMLMSI
jgi:hypothetical protein